MNPEEWASSPHPTPGGGQPGRTTVIVYTPEAQAEQDDVQRLILEERRKETLKIEEDTQALAETFVATQQMISQQGQRLATAEDLFDSIEDDTEAAVAALDQAAERKGRSRWRIATALGVLGGLVVAAVGTVVTIKSIGNSSAPQ